ncbi:MAG: hypothetical protein PHH27_03405 [Candidatus Colwellbacteria bacterium]|nr:hypothetical protein [Candidatus Colwellbacteria bacterium]
MEYRKLEDFKDSCGYVINDIWYPRVTSIVGIKAKPALYRYYASLPNFEAGERIKQKSADEGTLIHEVVQAIMVGETPKLSDENQPAAEAYIKFNEKLNIKTRKEYIEKRIINFDERYSGTVDAIAEINGKVGVLDIKTSQAIYRDYCLQTSAYMAPLQYEIPEISTRWILRIDQNQTCRKCGAIKRIKGGREKIKLPWKNPFARNCDHEWSEVKGEIEIKEFPNFAEDYEAFLGAKKLWEWENISWLKQLGYK